MSAGAQARPTLILAPQIGLDASVAARTVAARMVALVRQVRARGHAVRFLCSERPLTRLGRSAEIARLVEEQEPSAIRWLDIRSDRDAYYLLWPRDGLQDWLQFAAVAPEPSMAALAASFGIASPRVSPLCEGGLFVRSGEQVLVSSALAEGAEADLPSQVLCAIIPHPFASDLYRREQPSDVALTHIDFDCCLVRSPDGTPWCLVSDRYHRAYRPRFERAAERLGLHVFVAPQDEVMRRGLNLVALSPRAVLAPAGCPQILAFLSDLLGTEAVIALSIDETFNYNGGRGGLACMSTLVYER
ncbi:MAG TPA: hypothetical protein VF179_16505 [Thermoanaerobaculia bacterium]|nr:hypothetical protein [Thermoanaerobaculia bacterium]